MIFIITIVIICTFSITLEDPDLNSINYSYDALYRLDARPE